jgi:hypothetical protein
VGIGDADVGTLRLNPGLPESSELAAVARPSASNTGFIASKVNPQDVHLTLLTESPSKRRSSYRYLVGHSGHVMITSASGRHHHNNI